MSSDLPSPRRQRFQFSLRTLFEVVLAVAVGLTLWRMRDFKKLENEITRLARLCGEFDINLGEENLIHAVGVRSQNEYTWKWRIRTPMGKKCTLWWQANSAPAEDEYPVDAQHIPFDVTTQPASPRNLGVAVEYVVDLALAQDAQGNFMWTIRMQDSLGRSRDRFELDPGKDFSKWYNGKTRMESNAALVSCQAIKDKRPLTLIRFCPLPPSSDPNGPGIKLWLTEE